MSIFDYNESIEMSSFANVEDTLLAHHTIASHFPQRLDFVVSEYCDSAPWKIKFGRKGQEEKGLAPSDMPGDELCKYNASDARLTALVWSRMQGDLAAERAIYEHDKQIARLCQGMMVSGIGVDFRRQAELSAQLKARAAGLKGRMRSLLRKEDFSPSSLDDVRKGLFKTLRARYTTLTPGGLPSTSDAALEALQDDDTRAGQFAKLLLQWRVVKKIKSTYVDVLEPGHERTLINPRTRRAHFNWKSFGTVSGRLSCRFQSIPRYGLDPEEKVRELYIPAEGNEFVYFDISQAEMRVAAYLSCDPVLIAACNGDVHANNAKLVFPKEAAQGWLDADAKKDPKRGKPFRDISKNFGFAIAYGAEADKLFITLRRKGFNVSYQAVQVILARLHSNYKVYYAFVEENLQRVRREGHLRTPLLGRIRWLGWYPDLPDVANFPIQSTVADVMNLRMIALSRRLGEVPWGASVRLVAQIHDACVFDTPKKYAKYLEDEIQKIWGEPIAFAGGMCMLPIDLKRGSRLSDL